MNFLIHLYVADQNRDSLIGHFLGDFVKGNKLQRFDRPIQAAIRCHRKIDTFSDSHDATRRSRRRISKLRRRFAGVIVDVCYDHFLARQWQCFEQVSLKSFTRKVYRELQHHRQLLSAHEQLVLDRMIDYDWLGSYYHLENVGIALDRISTRLTRGEAFLGSISDVEANYEGLERDFNAFFPDLIEFSKTIADL